MKTLLDAAARVVKEWDEDEIGRIDGEHIRALNDELHKIDNPEPVDATPLSLAWIRSVVLNADRIFVREQVDGSWGSHPLSALSEERQAHWIDRWAREGRRCP